MHKHAITRYSIQYTSPLRGPRPLQIAYTLVGCIICPLSVKCLPALSTHLYALIGLWCRLTVDPLKTGRGLCEAAIRPAQQSPVEVLRAASGSPPHRVQCMLETGTGT